MLGFPTYGKENVPRLHASYEFRRCRHCALRLFLRSLEGLRQKAQTAKGQKSSSNW